MIPSWHSVELAAITGELMQVDIYGAESLQGAFCAHRRIIVIVPGATSKNFPPYASVYADLSEFLARRGFLCVTFAARGQTPTLGTWSHRNAEEDLPRVVCFLQEHDAGPDSIGLFGRSSGANVALSYADRHPTGVGAVAVWGTCYRRFFEAFYSDLDHARSALQDSGTILVQQFALSEESFAEDLLPKIQVPLFMGYGTKDTYSTLGEQVEAFSLVRTRSCTLSIIKDAIHAMDRHHPAFEYYAGTVAMWFESTLVKTDLGASTPYLRRRPPPRGSPGNS